MDVVTNEKRIGVFDSGVGGLSVLSELKRLGLNLDVVYLADTKNLPYGDKNERELTDILFQIFDFFSQQRVELVIAACNTSTSILLGSHRHILNQQKFKLLNVIEPVVVRAKSFKTVGVIANKYTAEHGIYKRLICGENADGNVISVACPALVPLIESGKDIASVKPSLFGYLEQFETPLDAIILGCTHYSLLKEYVGEFFKNSPVIIDSGQEVVSVLNAQLGATSGRFDVRFCVTGDATEFVKIASNLYAFDFDDVCHVVL
ncbi:MAG: glutamate racemase [Oscillospiraceae bacterium]|jgi:glutamate racemase|nr:glutamate racemase [Oscillospiraceae bacterium]